MQFCDISLMMTLELRLINFIPSFTQAFRGRYNIKLTGDIIKGFFIKNGLGKEGGYEELIKRLEKTKDV